MTNGLKYKMHVNRYATINMQAIWLIVDFILFLSCKSQINSSCETYEIFYETRYKSTSAPSAFSAWRETCFRVRGWMDYSKGRRDVSASCRKNYMIAGKARALLPSPLPSTPLFFCSFPSSFGLENMISFVPGVYSGVTAEQETGKGVVVVRTLRIL